MATDHEAVGEAWTKGGDLVEGEAEKKGMLPGWLKTRLIFLVALLMLTFGIQPLVNFAPWLHAVLVIICFLFVYPMLV